MDPDAALAEIRTLVARLDATTTAGPPFVYDPDGVARLAELVRSLDEWLSAGGFRPDAWKIPS